MNAISGWRIKMVVAFGAIFTVEALATRPSGASEIGSKPSRQQSARRALDAGNGMLGQGLYDLADAEYQACLAADPEPVVERLARYGLGVCHFRRARHEDVVATLDGLAGIDAFPYRVESGVMVGRSLLALKRWDEAREAFDVAVELDSKHALAPTALSGAIEALYHTNAYPEVARRAARDTSRLTGAMKQRVVYLHALAEMRAERYAEAIALLSDLLELEPDQALGDQARLLIGQCRARLGALPEALAWFEKVVSNENGSLRDEARLAAADANYRLGNHKRALADTRAVREQDSDPARQARAAYLQGRLYFDAEDYPAAVEAFQVAQSGAGAGEDELAYWLAKCALRLGEPGDAAKQFAELIEAHPKSAWVESAQYDRAVALLQSGKAGDARSAFSQFVEAHPEHALAPNALHLSALAARRDDDPAGCLEGCTHYAAMYPDGPQVADVTLLAGRCAADAGDWPIALQHFDKFAKTFASDERTPVALHEAGLAAYRIREFDAAGERFERLIQDKKLPVEFVDAALALGDMAYQRGEWKEAAHWLSQYLDVADDPAGADDALLKRGIALRKLGQHESALADFEALVDKFPNSTHGTRAQLERGQVLAELGRTDEASAALARVSRDEGADALGALATFQRAVLAMRSNRFEDATAEFGKLIDSAGTLEDQRAESRFQRAQCHIAMDNFPAAQTDLRVLREEHTNHARGASAAAWEIIVLARQDQAAEVVDAFAKLPSAIRDRLDDATRTALLSEVAWALRATDKLAAARKAYREVLAQPNLANDAKAHAQLAVSEIDAKQGRCADALPKLAELAEARAGVPEVVRERALYRLGKCAFDAEQFEQSAKYFVELLEAFPNTANAAEANLYCGDALLRTGRAGAARKHLETVVQSQAGNATRAAGMLRLGECLAIEQNWVGSEKVLSEYLKTFADTPQWYQAKFGIAWAREHQARYDEAIAAYRAVVDRHEGASAARAQFQIGECLFAQKKLDDAVRELLKVDILYAYPEWSAAALYEAGRCFEQLRKPVEARQQFQAVVDRFSDSQWANPASERLPQLTSNVVPGR